MRTKQDINENQCEKCGKIEEAGELTCGIEDTKWEGLALCNDCVIEQERVLRGVEINIKGSEYNVKDDKGKKVEFGSYIPKGVVLAMKGETK